MHYLRSLKRSDFKRPLLGRRWKLRGDYNRRHVAFGGGFNVCDDVIVTGCEGWDPDDKQRFKRRFAEEFNKPLLRFHFISGLQGLVARNSGDEAGLASSGIKALEARVTELADPDGRVAAIESALRDFATDLREWISRFRTGRHEPLAEWWRPDSWSRWAASCPGIPLRHELSRILMP